MISTHGTGTTDQIDLRSLYELRFEKQFIYYWIYTMSVQELSGPLNENVTFLFVKLTT